MTVGRTADILAALAREGPAPSWPGHLVRACRTSLDLTGVGLAVMDAAGGGGVLAATAGPAQDMEDLQFVVGEGPCKDAARSGRPVLVPVLDVSGAVRWPAYTDGARSRGVSAVFTFPLQVGAIAIGVLDLYSGTCGSLTDQQVGEALAYADAAIAVLLVLQYSPAPGDRGPRGEAELVPDPRGEAGALLDRHAVLHQAVGMVSVQLAASLTDALLRLRAHAFALDRSMLAVCADVVSRRLRFDDSEVGTSAAPPDPPGTRPAGEEPT
jgi:GAF domain-containing protein